MITVEKGCNFRMFSDRKALQQARCLNGVVRVWISRAMVQIRISFVLLQMETLQIGGAGVHSSLLLINQGTSFCIC